MGGNDDSFRHQAYGGSLYLPTRHRSLSTEQIYTMDWLKAQAIGMLPWPVRSPDLNPIIQPAELYCC